jgi:phage terminase, large subunit, PBSX family|nr:MAG TPA: terminase large subunit [Caudoviricetes sp.]
MAVERETNTPVHSVYHPLYTNKDKFIVLITGGRGSGKSFEVARFLERLTFEKGRKILFTRYTLVSASKSIIPEVEDKIERDGTQEYFKVTKDRIINKYTGSELMFMGILASSGNQTAKLKSIQGVSVFVCDEAEEWRSEEDYDKMVLSIRTKGVQNMVIVVMNPASTSHFVYQKYIKDTHRIEVIDGVPVQISTHPNVLHIHTTYLDNLEYLSREFVSEIEDIKANNPEKYQRIVIGKWSEMNEGAIFKKYSVVDSMPHFVQRCGLGLDFGYTNDPTAGIFCGVYGNTLYLDEVCYNTHMGSGDIIKALRQYSSFDITADSADPRLIDELRAGGLRVSPVVKGSGSVIAGINKMLEMDICITARSKNLQYELDNYCWAKDKDGQYTNEPIDANNHLIDATRYYILRNILGWSGTQRRSYEGIF